MKTAWHFDEKLKKQGAAFDIFKLAVRSVSLPANAVLIVRLSPLSAKLRFCSDST